MSPENVELVRQGVAAFNRRDMKALEALSAADAELVPLRAALEGTAYRGPGAWAQAFRDFDESWTDLRFTVEEIRPVGDRVVAIARLGGRGRASGVDIDARLALLFGFRAGKIVRMQTYTDVAEALKAAGLQE
jgi:ketosteroid isomerase-like protein